MNLYKTNKLIPIVMLCLALLINCSADTKQGEASVGQSIPGGMDEALFDCKTLQNNVNSLKVVFDIDSIESVSDLKNVGAAFYRLYLEKNFGISQANEFKYYSYIKNTECNIIILRCIDSNPSALYLLIFSTQGTLKSTEVLAKKMSYPGSETVIKSRIINKSTFSKIRLEGYIGDYLEKEDRYTEITDSIYHELKILDNGELKEIKKDSVRKEN